MRCFACCAREILLCYFTAFSIYFIGQVLKDKECVIMLNFIDAESISFQLLLGNSAVTPHPPLH